MSNEFDMGFKECEENYLVPLQSRLQEILQDRTIEAGLYDELAAILEASDFRKVWKLPADEKALDTMVEADISHQEHGL